MATSQRQIFRQKAIEQHRLRQERDVLPPWTRPRVAVFLWILIGLLIGTCILLWSVRVPTLVTVNGVVTQMPEKRGTLLTGDVVAVILLTPAQRSLLHSNLPVTIRLITSGVTMHQSLTFVESRMLGPDAIRDRYHLQGNQTQLLSGPQIIALVRLGASQEAPELVGSVCQADVQVGSRRVLSLIPLLGNFFPE